MAGNRCDHNPRALRLCDIVRRGKGGHPQLLGVISSYLVHAGRDRGKLPALAKLNASGRRKRTERYETILAVCGFLTARWFQPDTRRCVMATEQFLEVPDVTYIAGEISRSAEWKGKARLSPARVYDAIGDLEAAGYVKRSRQAREPIEDGRWIARPKILAFTKQFFLDLGGKRLWQSVRVKGRRLVQDLRAHLAFKLGTVKAAAAALAHYLNPGRLLSPGQAREYTRRHGRPPSPHLEVQRAIHLQVDPSELPAF